VSPELTTDQKGAVAETAIVHAAVKLGIGVFKPLTEGERYDLIFNLRPRLLRVQCKWCLRQGEVVLVRCYSTRRTLTGMRNRPYTADEVDAIAAYCAELNRCYLIPIEMVDGRRGIQLRLAPALNGQQRLIHWAHEFEFERLHWERFGAIAQLGERLAGSQKVAGSSPAGSTLF
jgi:PD-(D/E)XK endonuclease